MAPGADDAVTEQIAEWTQAQQRVTALAEGLDDAGAGTVVPACPDWTVHDLLAHMIGLDADVLAGNEPDDHNPAWTQAHVDSRRDASIADLLAEWHALVGPLQQWMRENNTRPLGDVVIHEQDLRAALGLPGARDTPGLVAIRERMLTRVAGKIADLPPLALVGDTFTWCSDGPEENAAVVVRASDYDLTRAVLSRRSAAQVRSWTERGDVQPFLSALSALGPLPGDDVIE